MKTASWLTLTLVLGVGSAAAQGTPRLSPGVRVRVNTPDMTAVGNLISVDSVLVTIMREGGTPLQLPVAGTLVDVSTGPRMCSPGRRSTCVLVGLLAGAAVGFGTGEIIESTCDFCGGQVTPYTTIGGAVAGALVGSLIGGERWTRVELPVRVTPAVGTSGAPSSWPGVRAAVHLSF
jgi:hypothetical protein